MAEPPSRPGARLPYFDMLLALIESGHADVATAFGRHVHWGYWPEPERATGDATDFAAAAERLTVEICRAADIGDDQAVLDVGCGFGGTPASLNEQFNGLRMTGLNIDPRQLARARQLVVPRKRNTIDFVEGTASALPFPDRSLDRVLAVEAIFHFPSRRQFFAEAFRVLRPGGRLALSDFVPAPWIQWSPFLKMATRHYGDCDLTHSLPRYRRLAFETGFRIVVERDVTANTMPTYAFLETLSAAAGHHGNRRAAAIETRLLRFVSWARALRYCILALEKP